MKIVLIGIVGAGKSTQGNLLSRQLGIPYLSTGHIFRRISIEKTQLGRYIKETMSAGLLIPDDKTLEIVEDYLRRPEYKKGYILDGFPRTLVQAKKFVNGIDKVVYIELPDKEALWRIAAYRNGSETRLDDTVNALKKRIDIFHKIVTPVIEYYEKRGQLCVVDGAKTITEVNRQILKSLGKQLVKNKISDWRLAKKIIIGVVGLAGSGKTTATDFFKEEQLPVIDFGKIVNEYIDRHHLTHTEKDHQIIRNQFRQKHGMEAFAVLNEQNTSQFLEKSPIVVINGLRSYEEYLFLIKKFPDVTIVLICVWASKETRNHRIKQRSRRSKFYGKERDQNEVIEANMGPTLALADYMVINESSLEEFYYKLENIYRELYFG